MTTDLSTIKPIGAKAGAGIVTVVGAGAGGSAAAVDLALAGETVHLWEPWPAAEMPGQIHYTGLLGDGVLELTDGPTPEEAVSSSDVVVIATRATALNLLLESLAPVLKPVQLVIAACGGLVALALSVHLESLSRKRPLLGELSCFPYSARFDDSGRIVVRRKRAVRVAAVPEDRTVEMAKRLPEGWFGGLAWDVIHCAMLNPNYVLHPPAVAINVASRDRDEVVPAEGMTKGSNRLASALDQERVLVLDALGYPPTTLSEIMNELTSSSLSSEDPPPIPDEKILERFIVEDGMWGLSLLSALAVRAGVLVPIADALRTVITTAYPDLNTEIPVDRLGWSHEAARSR